MGVDYLRRFTRDFVEEFRLGRCILDASVASSWMNSTWWQNWLQENSATAGIHLRPGTSCETIWDPLRPSKTIWDYLRLSKTIWDHPRQSEAMWDHLRPSKTLWGPLRPFETIWDPLRTRTTSGTIWGRANASILSMGPKVFFATDGISLLNEGIVSCQFTLQ